MASPSVCLELDRAIDRLLTDHVQPFPAVDPALQELVGVAAELRHIASSGFRAGLKHDLQARVTRRGTIASRVDSASPHLVRRTVSRPSARPSEADFMPSLLGLPASASVSRGSNFALSFAAHAAAAALILFSGVWFGQRHERVRTRVFALTTEISPYVLPPASTRSGGGGGGGDQDKLRASYGTPPRFTEQQLTPPVVVLRNPDPKLAAEATVVGPPTLRLPQSGITGDPMALFGPPSNGPGSGGGIGDGSRGGVGSGLGPGVGPGSWGGIGNGPYRVGGGVSAPRAIYQPDPEFSEEARKAKYQGVVVLWCVVGPDGRVHDARVQHSLGFGLDEKAIEAVKTWKFEPGRKDGVPVAVQINVEVSFRLY